MKLMKNIMVATALLMATPMVVSTSAMADEYPLVAGDYMEVSGIFVHDGSMLKYANHLAKSWVEYQEFAKSKGWIKDYKIYGNVHPREGEANLYLTVTYSSIPSAAEGEKRNKEWLAKFKTSNKKMAAESGSRAEYRTLKSNSLLQEYTVR